MDAQRDLCSIPPGDRQQLHHVSQFAGEFNLGILKLVDALEVDVASFTWALNASDARIANFCAASRPETSMVGSASAKPSFCASASAWPICPAVAGHLGEDEIARAVDDADQRVDAVCDQSVHEGVDDGNSAGAACLKGDAGFVFARQGKKLRSVGGKQAFVCGDDGLAKAQSALDHCRAVSVPPINSTTICVAGSSIARSASA